jgi:hypothetical protein
MTHFELIGLPDIHQNRVRHVTPFFHGIIYLVSVEEEHYDSSGFLQEKFAAGIHQQMNASDFIDGNESAFVSLTSDILNHWRSQQTERFLSGAEYPDCSAGKDRCSFTAITVDI